MSKRRYMNCSLPKELRRRFNIAWRMLPLSTQVILGEYVWRIRSEYSLLNHVVYFPRGHQLSSEIDAIGWCVPDIDATSVYICYSRQLETADEAQAIAVILHELAHALIYSEDEDWWSENRLNEQDEVAAWAQVANWSARNASKPSGGGYTRAREIVEYGLSGALKDWEVWTEINIIPRVMIQAEVFDGFSKLAKMLTDNSSTSDTNL